MLILDCLPDLLRVKMSAADGDHGTATGESAQSGEKAGAMHLWADRHTSVAGSRCQNIGHMFFKIGGRSNILIDDGATTASSPDILMGPHDAFGHAGCATGINEQQVIPLSFKV